MKSSLRKTLLIYMLAVIVGTAAIRIALWGMHQIYEMRKGHVVLHEQIGEFLFLVLIEVIALPLLALMLWKVSKVILSPLRSIANASQLIYRGKLSKRIRIDHLPTGELLDIAKALNSAFDRYQTALDNVSRFSSEASHQMRTPLTNIRTTAELCLTTAKSEDDYVDSLESILEEAQKLSRMVEQLLALARMETEYLHREFQACDLNELTGRVLEHYEPLAESKQIRVERELADNCVVRGEPILLMEAITNLVDNAFKVTPDRGVIKLSTGFTKSDQAFIAITDSGPGIDESFKEQIFEPFKRHPAAEYKGAGLGLAIVYQIVKLHHGSIEIDSHHHRGATFRMIVGG